MHRLPRAASVTAPASLPPHGLEGLDPRFSRLVTTLAHDDAPTSPERDQRDRTWHVLDNAERLADLGVEPVGTILCVHGNPTWSYLWRRLVSAATDAAADGHDAWRVVAVDQLDMGFSERTGRPRPLPQRVRDLGRLTDTLGLTGTPVVTLGHDWGGVVSLGWAVDHRDDLLGVMLLNTAVHQPEQDPIPAPLRLALRPRVLGAATVTSPAFLETTLALAHPALPAAIKDAYRAPYRTAERRGGIGGFVADIPVDSAHPSSDELDRIAEGVRALTVPALMLWGPRDPIFSDRYLDDLADRLPHADVHRFEGAGHLVAEDVVYAAAALTWLGDRLPSGAATPARATASPVGPGTQGPDGAARDADEADRDQPYVPLWHHLDALSDREDTALVEMAPSSGAGPRSVSWRLLARRVRELAMGLESVGVRKGDRVSLLVQPGADLTAVLYACVRIGAVVVVADAGLGLRGLTRAVRGAWPDHVIGAVPGLAAARALGWPGQKISTTDLPRATARALGVCWSLADLVERGAERLGDDDGRSALGAGAPPVACDLPPAPEPTDVAAVLFTSGSTGPAKGVVYTHAQLAAVARALATQYEMGVGTGLVAGFAPFALLGPALGACSVTPDMNVTSPRTLTARAVADAVAAVDATVLFLSPAALTNVVATSGELTDSDHAALAGVRTFLSAGAPVSERLLTEAARLMPGATPHTPYGMTEGLLLTDITLAGIRDASRGADAAPSDVSATTDASSSADAPTQTPTPAGVCVGTPAAGVDVRISALDEAGAAAGVPSTEAGVTGEVVVRAAHVKDHYDRLWLTNRASKDASSTDERWHRTGDVGHLDDAGRLWIEGRLAHVVVTAAGVVTPVGLEQQVESVPQVRRAAVVGVGPVGTQLLVAVVETDPAPRRVRLATPELAGEVRAVTSRPLAAVLVVPALPTDVRHNSKIDRAHLARWATTVLAGGRLRRP